MLAETIYLGRTERLNAYMTPLIERHGAGVLVGFGLAVNAREPNQHRVDYLVAKELPDATFTMQSKYVCTANHGLLLPMVDLTNTMTRALDLKYMQPLVEQAVIGFPTELLENRPPLLALKLRVALEPMLESLIATELEMGEKGMLTHLQDFGVPWQHAKGLYQLSSDFWRHQQPEEQQHE